MTAKMLSEVLSTEKYSAKLPTGSLRIKKDDETLGKKGSSAPHAKDPELHRLNEGH